MEEIFKTTDIVLLQEHWLFHNQLDCDICETISYAAKSVDMNNPILPTQMPRGYGGVAIIWKKCINHLIRELPEGNERIQCVELNEASGNKIFVVSVYLPTKGGKVAMRDYLDCIQQLYETVQKYSETHCLIIGGYINENLNQTDAQAANNVRLRELKNLIKNVICAMTVVNAQGIECSEFDYL